MTLEEQLDEEQKHNNFLAREIARLTGESKLDLMQALKVGGYIEELKRQKRESDERLVLLKQRAAAPRRLPGGQVKWYQSDTDILRRRQVVLKNPNMRSKGLCKVLDGASIPLPRDWQAELKVDTWSRAYQNRTGRKRIQKIFSTDRRSERSGSS